MQDGTGTSHPHHPEIPEDEGGGLATLVLERETIRKLTSRVPLIEAIGKKKTKDATEACVPETTNWPKCSDFTTPQTECPVDTPPGSEPPTG